MVDVTYEDYQDLVRKLSLANERVRDLQERVSGRDAFIDALEAQLAEKEAEVGRLREQVELANFAARNGESLASDAIHEIRELLKAHDVPVATFIDDHVRNAIVQRNQERDRAEDLTRQLAEREAEMEEWLTQKEAEISASWDDGWYRAMSSSSHPAWTRVKELERQLAEAKRFIEMALDYEGDVFGRHHNDVVDLLLPAAPATSKGGADHG